MRLLLDTHAFLWSQNDPDRLGRYRSAVEDPEVEILLSAATSWEIAVKHATGRLALSDAPVRWVTSRARRLDARLLDITHAHALAVGDLPLLHRDPFDRLLVVQSRAESASLLTADPLVLAYGGDVLDMRA